MILKKCTVCGKFFHYNGHSKCSECAEKASENRRKNDKIYNQKYRNKESDRFYHCAAWKQLSRLVLVRANYRCALCGGLATEVHHIKEVTECPEMRLDPANLMPLCTSCHNKQRK